MRVLIFGATGMVGQGVLLACLKAADVECLRTVGRAKTGRVDPKLDEVVHDDLFDLGTFEGELQPFDACFFCLGVSSLGMQEPAYTRLTYDLTLAIAQPLARLNPQMTFVYVSGASTDSSERGKAMWARVKGRTENALQRLSFKAVYLFRPGVMLPVEGFKSKTRWYSAIYALLGPVFKIVTAVRPGSLLTTEGLGNAMLEVTRHGASAPVVEVPELKALANRHRAG
jgi:uncharacterized protein YbjT (DUF2867 family)